VTEVTERLCPSCGQASPPDAQFCRECGAILVQGRGGGMRSATAHEVESWKPTPGEMSQSPSRRRGRRLAAILVAGLLIVALLIAYQRKRAGTLPVPGQQQAEVTPAPSPAEQRAEAASPKPTTIPPASREPEPALEQARAKPTASAPSEVAAVKPTTIPPASHESAPALEQAPARPARNPPPEPTADPSRRRRPGWYLVRYRTPLFQSPSETAAIVTYLAPGTRIRVTRALPGFLAVESTTGKPPGYVSSDDVLPESVAGTYP
jgi:predicted nucleic acid-binding Zn ribbon protein